MTAAVKALHDTTMCRATKRTPSRTSSCFPALSPKKSSQATGPSLTRSKATTAAIIPASHWGVPLEQNTRYVPTDAAAGSSRDTVRFVRNLNMPFLLELLLKCQLLRLRHCENVMGQIL